MGIGHVAVGFAAKRVVPGAPLALLLVSTVFLDVLWGGAILAGIERAHIDPTMHVAMPLRLEWLPWTHSLVTSLGWSALFAVGAFALTRRWLVAVVSFFGVLSHWVLDAVSHTPDVPVGIHGPLVGLGLWRWPWASVLVECLMLAGGLWLFLDATRAAGSRGRTGVVILGVVLCGFAAAAYLGPPPPSVTPLAVMNILVAGICIGLGTWLDRRRHA